MSKTKYYYAFLDKSQFRQLLDETLNYNALLYFKGKMTIGGKPAEITDDSVRHILGNDAPIIVKFKEQNDAILPAIVSMISVNGYRFNDAQTHLLPVAYHLCNVQLQGNHTWLTISKTTEENKDAKRGIVYTKDHLNDLESVRNVLNLQNN